MTAKAWLRLLALNGLAAFVTYGMTQFGSSLVNSGANWIGGLMIVAFAAPTMWSWWCWQRQSGLVLMTLLGGYALLFESFAVATGFPYGQFSYIDAFGAKVWGLVPWTVAFAWMPIALGAWIVANHFFPRVRWARIALTAGVLVLYDLILDPSAVALGYWVWAQPGWYYGIPWSNFIGWFISGIGGAVLIEQLTRSNHELRFSKTGITTTLLLSLLLWTWVNGWIGLSVPFFGGLLLILGLSALNFRWRVTN